MTCHKDHIAYEGRLTPGHVILQGFTITVPIIYGNISIPLMAGDEMLKDAPAQHTHRWTLFVRPYDPPTDDMSFLFRKVTFKLHESFPNCTRGKSRQVLAQEARFTGVNIDE